MLVYRGFKLGNKREFGDEILMNFQLDYQNRKPLFITSAGLQGTGKTTLARSLAKKLSLVYLRLDCVEVPFYRYNATSGSKGEGYDAIVNFAREKRNSWMRSNGATA